MPTAVANAEKSNGKAAAGAERQDPSSRARDEADFAAAWLPIVALKGWERNPRKHGATVPKLVRAIIRYGWGSPIEARTENLEIIAGHGRMQAAERLSTKWQKTSVARRERWHPEAQRVAETGHVPVRLRDLDEDDAHQAALSDNRIGQESSWDKQALGDLLEDFEDELDSMGFDESELQGDGIGGNGAQVEVFELTSRFTLTVSGPLPKQAVVLDRLRSGLEQIDGVSFDCFVESVGTDGGYEG